MRKGLNQFVVAVESLEMRRHLSASMINDDHLEIVGTEGDDQIALVAWNESGHLRVKTVVNGEAKSFIDPMYINLSAQEGKDDISVDFVGKDYVETSEVWEDGYRRSFYMHVDAGEGADRMTVKTDTRGSFTGGSGGDLITIKDSIQISDGTAYFIGDAGRDTIIGSAGADQIYGGNGADRIVGGPGNDHIDGGYGNDTLNGNSGDDNLHGSYGADVLNGQFGRDYIDGDSGSDILSGGTGDDYMNGGAGHDVLFGNDGDDNMSDASGRDSLYGGLGDDHLSVIGEDDSDSDLLDGGKEVGAQDVLWLSYYRDDELVSGDQVSNFWRVMWIFGDEYGKG